MTQEARLAALAQAVGADVKSHGLRLASIEPATLTLGYDAQGRLATVNRAGGVVKTLGYDAGGRLATVVIVTPGGPTVTRTLTRDAQGRLSGVTIS